MPSDKPINLEKTLADLELLVEELESGTLSLDDAMKKFEEGVKLTRMCQKTLKEAEQKVELLLQNSDGEDELMPFDNENESNQ
jgi:exodeoxyribonuclease VII small subunit